MPRGLGSVAQLAVTLLRELLLWLGTLESLLRVQEVKARVTAFINRKAFHWAAPSALEGIVRIPAKLTGDSGGR